jgi:hypothetical protein
MGFPLHPQGPGLFVAPIPRCPFHGQMSMRLGCDPSPGRTAFAEAYVCHGYDGEGCDHVVLGADREWTHIGHADRIDIDWER